MSYFLLANEDSSGSVGTDAPYVIKVVRDSVYLFVVADGRYMSRVLISSIACDVWVVRIFF